MFVDQGQFVLARLQREQTLETSTSVINSLSLNLDDVLFYVIRLYGTAGKVPLPA